MKGEARSTFTPAFVDALVLGGAAGCGMTKRCAVWMAITYGAFLYMFWQLYKDKNWFSLVRP